jgi:uncharacterized protein YjbI with pentapeptide repeats
VGKFARFDRNKYPQKWQINQEDLEQSREAWNAEKPNLIRDILDRPGKIRNLRGVNLSGVNLSGANLSGANLVEANLSYANLSGANLVQANLSYANLNNTDLSNANLSGANVNKAKFKYSQGISESMRQDLIARGANFEDTPLDRFLKLLQDF